MVPTETSEYVTLNGLYCISQEWLLRIVSDGTENKFTRLEQPREFY